jgi:hypothetical protein
VNLPAAKSIGNTAFGQTGNTSLTVTLGKTPPTLGQQMFYSVSSAKTVTVLVPSDATGYGEVPHEYRHSYKDSENNWGNGFGGKGWDGTTYVYSSYVNGNITVNIEYRDDPE